MVFKTIGNQSAPAILFFHAMGVTGESSMPVAEKLILLHHAYINRVLFRAEILRQKR